MAAITAPQMAYEAKIIYESIASADAPGYNNREWSILLTQAQEWIVLEICKEGADKDEFNRRALSPLFTSPAAITSFTAGTYPNSYVVTMPVDYLYALNERGSSTGTGFVRTDIEIKSISFDTYNANRYNPFYQPCDWLFWKMVVGGNHLVITDGGVLSSYKLDYIKKPTPIIVSTLSAGQEIEGLVAQTNCILDHSIHRKIIYKAAVLAKMAIQDQLGYQLQNIEEKSIN
jgi:hypothetical protein